jgi:hypothetical protein
MNKTIQALAAAAVLTAGMAGQASASSSLTFSEASNGAFTEVFTITPTITNELRLTVSGMASQFADLTATLWDGSTQLASFGSLAQFGNRALGLNDSKNNTFTLVSGQNYTLKLAGISSAAPNNAVGTITVYNGSVTAVPEPETFALLLAGLGLVGAAAKRGRQKSA